MREAVSLSSILLRHEGCHTQQNELQKCACTRLQIDILLGRRVAGSTFNCVQKEEAAMALVKVVAARQSDT